MRPILLCLAALFTLTACTPKGKTVFVQTEAVQLSRPVVRVEHHFFEQEATLHPGPPQERTAVRYSMGTDSLHAGSPVADQSITVDESATLRFQRSGGGFIPSEEVVVEVLKLRPEKTSLTAASFASPPYHETPQAALTDRQKSGMDFRNEDWVGYQKETVTYVLSFPSAQVSGITLSCLEDQASWIFAPSALKATFYDVAGNPLRTVTKRYLAELQKPKSFRFLTLTTRQLRAASIKLEVESLSAIPSWHPGKGSSPWLFVDEVLLR